LLRIELLELVTERRLPGKEKIRLHAKLTEIMERDEEKRGLIENGLKLIG
jgi:hypothetical protein